ncbi:hypothetical protein BFP72_09350 [Reichenbachiella sp. 5M10]|nr:hypothetical protein BFP72_09350 [Reichenbachiella sp. 5M10]
MIMVQSRILILFIFLLNLLIPAGLPSTFRSPQNYHNYRDKQQQLLIPTQLDDTIKTDKLFQIKHILHCLKSYYFLYV